MLQQYAHGLAVLHRARTAEVQAFETSVRHPHDVVRADVAVDDAGSMEHTDVAHERLQHGEKLLSREPALSLHLVAEGHSVEVFHYEIGRAVGREEILHLDD